MDLARGHGGAPSSAGSVETEETAKCVEGLLGQHLLSGLGEGLQGLADDFAVCREDGTC
jgi:hypothetical protein